MTFVCFIVFLLWAFIPEEVLHGMGIFYYPNRYWAIALPTYGCMFLLFLIASYVALCHMATPFLSEKRTMTDKFARPVADKVVDLGPKSSVPPLWDIPLTTVNELMFGHLVGHRRRFGHR